jgi:hypothetical protein
MNLWDLFAWIGLIFSLSAGVLAAAAIVTVFARALAISIQLEKLRLLRARVTTLEAEGASR